MGVIWTPGKTRTTQPQGHALPRSEPNAECVFAYSGDQNSAYSSRRDSFGSSFDLGVSPYPFAASDQGYGFDNRATATEGVYWQDSSSGATAIHQFAGSFTFACVVSDFGWAGTNAGFWRNASNTRGNSQFSRNGSNGRPQLRLNNVWVLQPSDGPVWELGATHSLVLTFSAGEKVEVWWDGEKKHSVTTGHTNPNLLGTLGIYRVGNQFTGGERITGVWSGFSFFDGVISDGFAEEISNNYWSLYALRTRTIFLPTTVSGIPVLSLPFASGITTGSAIPNVTLTF